jgi:iron complex transport system ATP-binding protein
MRLTVHIQNLSLHLAGNHILDDICLSVHSGEFISIIGPNGAGKTSLIKCLCGIYHPDSGSIHIMGQDASKLHSRQRAKLLSYVPQAEGRSFPFTVEEFVLMGRYTSLSPFTTVAPDDRNAVAHALQQTGMESFRKRKINTLSGGERQMVFIAAALAQEAQILVLDEPASFLDYRHQAQVFTLLRRLNREAGHTIITVSHNLNTATHTSSRILALKHGKRVFFGTPSELLHKQQLEDIFDTSFRLIQETDQQTPFVMTEADV